MSKKKLTNKEITQAIDGLSKNDNILFELFQNKIIELQQYLALYLEFRKDTDKFDKFVKAKMEEFEQQRSKDKKGA